MVIVGGGNDLSTSRSPETIAKTLIDTGIDCVEASVPAEKVCISSVLPRDDSKLVGKRIRINDLLREKCEEKGFKFIENVDIVLSRHIRSDGVHLTKIGTNRLLENIVKALNDVLDEGECSESQSG